MYEQSELSLDREGRQAGGPRGLHLIIVSQLTVDAVWGDECVASL